MSEGNGHMPDAEDRLLESNVVWPPRWLLRTDDDEQGQIRRRADRIEELRQRFEGEGEAA